MMPDWWVQLRWWLCEKLGHPFYKKGWVYNGKYHKDCYCGRIVSEDVK